MDANVNLIDFKTIRDLKGEFKYYFYYPDKIDIFKISGSNFEKFFTIDLKWEQPYYPVKEYEGKLCYFYWENVLYLTVGGNFSEFSKVFTFSNNLWKEADKVKFVPFRYIILNNSSYLAGASYADAQNYFKDRIILYPFFKGKILKEKYYEKKVDEFYSIDFSTKEKVLDSIHIVDKNYNYKFLAADFEERTVDDNKKGSSMSTTNGEWLAVSDYSRNTDTLHFYKIENSGLRPVYENQINGEVVFISDGVWKNAQGFWIYVKLNVKKGKEYRLQFWSKRDE